MSITIQAPFQGSGDTPVVATASWEVRFAPAGDILIADGFGNVHNSGVMLSSLVSRIAGDIDIGTF